MRMQYVDGLDVLRAASRRRNARRSVAARLSTAVTSRGEVLDALELRGHNANDGQNKRPIGIVHSEYPRATVCCRWGWVTAS